MGREGKIQTVQWLHMNMFAVTENRMGSLRPDLPRVATSALISLLLYVSVGMQRVSSLRTQRVAGSNTECEAHKKEHDWQFKESPSFPITGPEEGGGIYDSTDVPLGEAGRGASPANRTRAVGGQTARRSTARW